MSWTIKGVNRTHTDFPFDQNKEWKEPFIFVQGADTQLGMFQDYEEITTEPKWAQEIALAELAVQKVNQMKPRPKFYVICGDLCHAFYGSSHGLSTVQVVSFALYLKAALGPQDNTPYSLSGLLEHIRDEQRRPGKKTVSIVLTLL
ncbi:Serine/threonine-protein phosphatase cpped1 [Homalodisca vitripennis]|nr:Serine/threonine-protein phosphatase cpped1 [Homalodisca vitripennis]